MADPAAPLAKAELRQLDAQFKDTIEQDTWITVQFNPESLKVSFANQLVQPSGAGDQQGSPSRQFVGAGTTKLTLQLWFDVTAPPAPGQSAVDDVRKLTAKVAFFITPKRVKGGKQDQYTPPAVRFIWGSFQFDGLVDSMEENLELFSPEGKPLRAGVSLSMSQQKILPYAFAPTAGGGGSSGSGGGGPKTPGVSPLTAAPAGATVQGLAAGAGASWQAVAAANGIENPRVLAPGQLLDLQIGAGGGVGISVGLGGSG